MLDALQQRLNRYREAGVQARAKGDERKARMHDRIAKVNPLLCSPYPMLAYPCFSLPVCFPYDPWSLFFVCLWSCCCFGTPFLLGLQFSPISSLSASAVRAQSLQTARNLFFPCSNIRMLFELIKQDRKLTLPSYLFHQVGDVWTL